MPRKQKDTKRVEPEEEGSFLQVYGRAKAAQQDDEHEYLQEDEYNVEAIMDMKVELGKKYYLIKWEGFAHSQNTWEPIEHLAKVAYMVEQFEEDYAKGKSLAMMAQENPGYFPIEEEEDFPLRKETRETKKKNDGREGNEMLFKKRKLNNINDDGEIMFEKKPVGEENSFDLGDDDGIQEITTIKEDLTKAKPRKKNAYNKVFTKAPPPEEDFEEENTLKNKSSPETHAMFATQMNDSPFDKESEKGVNGKQGRSLRGVVAGNKKTQSKPGRAAAKKKDKTGSFRNKDKPLAVLSTKMGREGGFDFLIEWQRRSDGSQPENSMVTNEEMKKNDPYFLIDFYEGKIEVINKHKPKKRDKETLLEKEKEPERMNVEEKSVVSIGETPASTIELPVQQLTKAKETTGVISLDEEMTPSKQKEIEQPRPENSEKKKKLIEVLDEHVNEPNFSSPVKETPAKGTLINPQTQEKFSLITSPQEIASTPGEEIIVNVRGGHSESSPDSDKKNIEIAADNMIGDYDLIEQHHDESWQQIHTTVESKEQGETQEKDVNPSLYSEIHANQAQHFVPSLDSEQLQAQRLMLEGDKEGEKEVNDEEDVGKNKETQSSLVSVI